MQKGAKYAYVITYLNEEDGDDVSMGAGREGEVLDG